jgi:hypothetical protein
MQKLLGWFEDLGGGVGIKENTTVEHKENSGHCLVDYQLVS